MASGVSEYPANWLRFVNGVAVDVTGTPSRGKIEIGPYRLSLKEAGSMRMFDPAHSGENNPRLHGGGAGGSHKVKPDREVDE